MTSLYGICVSGDPQLASAYRRLGQVSKGYLLVSGVFWHHLLSLALPDQRNRRQQRALAKITLSSTHVSKGSGPSKKGFVTTAFWREALKKMCAQLIFSHEEVLFSTTFSTRHPSFNSYQTTTPRSLAYLLASSA